MIKSKYSKDNLYLRALEKEKNQQRIKESNKVMQRIVNHSKEQIKHFQRLRSKNEPDFPFKSPKIVKSFNASEQSNYSDESFYRNKIMQPISSKSEEYEKAIQQFLGVGPVEVQVEKLRKVNKEKKTRRTTQEKRPQSSDELRKNEGVNEMWSEELRRIEEKEKQIQKNLKELNVKQKSVKVHSKSVKSPLKPKKEEGDIFKSLEQVNKLLTNFLKSSSPQGKGKKK